MTRPFAVCAGFLLCVSSRALAAPVRLEPVVLPEYSEIPHASAYATQADYSAAVTDHRFRMERLRYHSDGLTVFAYVYGPRALRGKLPIIVFNRGSWTWPNGFAGELLAMAHRLAERGYLVVAPMYRGSGGAAGRDEMGGSDLDDLLNLGPVLAHLPSGDPSHVYLYGESRGGMMVYQALREGFHARAAAVVGAFTDLNRMLASPGGAQAGGQIWPDLISNRAAIVARRSAIEWPDKIRTPILIIHGAADREVSPTQSLDMTARLLAANKPVQLVILDGEDHVTSGDPAGRDNLVLDWFQHH